MKHKSLLLFFNVDLCYNKYRRRSRRLYLRSEYREIHAVRRGFEYLFQHWLRKSEAFEESNQCYNKIKVINSQGRFYWNINPFACIEKGLCLGNGICLQILKRQRNAPQNTNLTRKYIYIHKYICELHRYMSM